MRESTNRDLRRTTTALITAMPTITPTELTVCLLLLDGKSTREIASDLTISRRTVDNHRYNIRRKLAAPGNLVVELLRIVGE